MRILFGSVAGMALAATVLLSGPAGAADKLAEEFGTLPSMWDVRLSPDGSKMSFLRMHQSDVPIAVVIDFAQKGKAHVAVASDPKNYDLIWCDWANNERLLCGARGVADVPNQPLKRYATTLLGTNFDGSKQKVFTPDKSLGPFAQPPDHVVDWLPDDPKHVLVQQFSGRGQGLVRFDVNSGATGAVEKSRASVVTWLADGHGHALAYNEVTRSESAWYVRPDTKSDWTLLHKGALQDLEVYRPVGFDDAGKTLYIIKDKDGRDALFAHQMTGGGEDTLVAAHPYVDLGDPVTLGATHAVAGIAYVTDRAHRAFFGARAQEVIGHVQPSFKGKDVSVVSESADGRTFILYVGSSDDAGAYYFMDAKKNAMGKLGDYMPRLAKTKLTATTPYTYKAADGSALHGFLTLPAGKTKKLPMVVIPAGGPMQPLGGRMTRAYGSVNWLAHYLAAKGYAVFESEYRGFDDYGQDWGAGGGFQNWQRAVGDVTDGVQALIADGTVDAKRICALGWTYGGYTALLSSAEHPDMFHCTVSIGGATNPIRMVGAAQKFTDYRSSNDVISLGSTVLRRGSPIERAGDVKSPVLMFQGEEDVTVPPTDAEDLLHALQKAKVNVDMVSYEKADNAFFRNEYRIDMLTRIGKFLKKSIGD